MENHQDVVSVKLHGNNHPATRQKKESERSSVALRIKDVSKNREIYVYNGIQKYILDSLMKEL